MTQPAPFDGRFFLIAGPCVLEDDALNLEVGEALAALASQTGVPIVFKASFDKANRSKPGAPRGPGWRRACAGWSG
jgi:2-dehydro-3-deoxyphosphooctonate aldolase (KDO 8-P synthase)